MATTDPIAEAKLALKAYCGSPTSMFVDHIFETAIRAHNRKMRELVPEIVVVREDYDSTTAYAVACAKAEGANDMRKLLVGEDQ